ncbi:MAG: hypothetical protein Q4P13_06290, partial [Psychrobacter sp.]|nr:hypothetical protein [Psychrobacter sp.]
MNQDINTLLSQLSAYPNDDKLLAKVALYYIEHPDGDKDLAYLEKAYQVNPSIENTHNLAFWLYHEYGDYERALLLQKQVMAQQPQSYYPYVSYAQMLLTQYKNEEGSLKLKDTIPKDADRHQEIISIYQLALSKINNLPVDQHQYHFEQSFYCLNNIGYAYAMLDAYDEAFIYFDKAMAFINKLLTDNFRSLPDVISTATLEEKHYEVLLNKVRLYILLDNRQQALVLLEQACANEQHCHLSIAQLYAMLGEYALADKLVGDEQIDESWAWIWYAISQVNHKKWRSMLAEALENEQAFLQDAKLEAEQLLLDDNQSEWTNQRAFIKESEATIAKLKAHLIAGSQPKPSGNLKPYFYSFYFGCLLYGCQRHLGLMDDSNSPTHH